MEKAMISYLSGKAADEVDGFDDEPDAGQPDAGQSTTRHRSTAS